MNPRLLTIPILIAAFGACGGGSPTTPSAPAAPPAVRGTWVDAPATTIGAVEITNGNTFPFGGPGGTTFPATTYQQVYLGSLFGSSPVRLTAVEFFAAPRNGVRDVTSATYTFSLSTRGRAVDALDTVNLAANVGANQQVVFGGVLGPGTVDDSRFRVTLSNPFSFTPAGGNLLLQVLRSSAGPSTGSGFLAHIPNDGYPPGLSSRAHDCGSNAATSVYLATRCSQQTC